jgi:hypothetical protein
VRFPLVPFILIAISSSLLSAAIPLTAKDVSLMLRTGYSSDAVLQEIATRHFGDTFDSAVEKQLVQAGASQALIQALRSGVYQSSPAEIAAAKKKRAAQAETAAEAVERADEPGDDSSRPTRSTASAQTQRGGSIYDHLKDDLVYWHQGTLQPFDDEVLEDKKFYLFFFSAIWSRAGQQFTPRLIDYYNRVSPQHPEFEVIFFSADRSLYSMRNYISETNMPWPAVAYDKLKGKAGAIENGLVRQIPCLILTNAAGNILSRSQSADNDTSGLEKVLSDLDKVLAGGATFQNTTAR